MFSCPGQDNRRDDGQIIVSRPWLSLWESWHAVRFDWEGPLQPRLRSVTSPITGSKMCGNDHVNIHFPYNFRKILLGILKQMCYDKS